MWGFIGNTAWVAFLRQAAASDRLAHAYLLTGPPQIGRRTLALRLAQALNCETSGASDPCLACRSCITAGKGAHPDVMFARPEEGRRAVTIEQVRELERAAALRSYCGGTKVFILTNADLMQGNAANALLKTLEEPAPKTLLLLTVEDAGHVLPTIASRCQEVALRPVPAAEIADGLTDLRGLRRAKADALARLAGGRPGWAIAAADQPALIEARRRHGAELEALLHQGIAQRLQAAAAAGDADVVRQRFDHWQGWWRDVLLVKGSCPSDVVQRDNLEGIEKAAREMTLPSIVSAVRRLQEARLQLDRNVNPRLALEGVLLDLPRL